ncbi:MAG: hypothetical protein ABIP50_03725 [Candidatus Saccharimonadales bacterium]
MESSIDLVDDLRLYLGVSVPEALSTKRHLLKKGSINVMWVAVDNNDQNVDILIEVKAMWDIRRWLTRNKRTVQIRNYLEVSLAKRSMKAHRSTVAVELHLSMSAYAGTGYNPDGFHTTLIPVTDWEEIGDGELVQSYGFPKGSYYDHDAADSVASVEVG